MNPNLAHFYFLTLFPWIKFGKSMKSHIIEHDLEKWNYGYSIVKLKELLAEEIVYMSKKIKLEFNFNPKKVANILI